MVKVTVTAPSEETVNVKVPFTCAPEALRPDQATDVVPILIGLGRVTCAVIPSVDVRLPRIVGSLALVLYAALVTCAGWPS